MITRALKPGERYDCGRIVIVTTLDPEPVAHQWRDTRGRWRLIRNDVELKALQDINATVRPLFAQMDKYL